MANDKHPLQKKFIPTHQKIVFFSNQVVTFSSSSGENLYTNFSISDYILKTIPIRPSFSNRRGVWIGDRFWIVGSTSGGKDKRTIGTTNRGRIFDELSSVTVKTNESQKLEWIKKKENVVTTIVRPSFYDQSFALYILNNRPLMTE